MDIQRKLKLILTLIGAVLVSNPRKRWRVLYRGDDGDNIGLVYVGSVADSNYIELRFKDSVPIADLDVMRLPVINWITNATFHETLP